MMAFLIGCIVLWWVIGLVCLGFIGLREDIRHYKKIKSELK